MNFGLFVIKYWNLSNTQIAYFNISIIWIDIDRLARQTAMDQIVVVQELKAL